MNLKEDICLKYLCGIHKFQGIELSTRTITDCFNYEYKCDVVKFMLDNITYEAIEDPDDGYRSYCSEIKISYEKPKYTFPDYKILCKMKPRDEDGEHDVLVGVDLDTGDTIFEIGTLYVDDYYPCCHFEYHPENMHF